LSSALIAAMSSSLSSKSKSSKFSWIRDGVVDFGKTMSPRWMCQLSVTWAVVRPRRIRDGGDGRVPQHGALGDRRPCLGQDPVLGPVRPDLLIAEVRMHFDLVDRRHHLGVSASRRRWGTWKVETPIDRARPDR
jgi:hypothetical protein